MTTIHESETADAVELTDEELEGLRGQVRGSVLIPSDDGYPGVRPAFNAMHTDRPAVAVRCTGTADVVAAVNFAREHGVEVTVRGGGHSIAGLSSTNGGFLIDLSSMDGVEVDLDARIARVQGGAILGDVDHETQAFGLAVPLGAVSETGVAGLTLGGGYGWLRRKYGLACDSLVSAQVVCADGSVRTASADLNPDLYWALRGGGGNFGIVTSFSFRLQPVGPMVALALVFYALDHAPQALRAYREYFRNAPDEVSAEAIVFSSRFPADPHLPEPVHGQQALVVAAVHSGNPEAGMKELQALRELAPSLADASSTAPYTMVQSSFDGFFPRAQLHAYWKSLYASELPDDAIELIVRRALERPPGNSDFELAYVDVYPMGGAVGRVAAEASAFGERTAPWLISLSANWTDETETAAQSDWVRGVWRELDEKLGTGGAYANFSGRGVDEDVPPAGMTEVNARRLAEVKRAYDPGNFFRRNNNIEPAT